MRNEHISQSAVSHDPFAVKSLVLPIEFRKEPQGRGRAARPFPAFYIPLAENGLWNWIFQ
jgi:hypothetical protein